MENENRFEEIKEAARNLPDGEPNIDLVLKPIIKVDRERYEELVRKEALLDMLLAYRKYSDYSSDVMKLANAVAIILGEEKEDELES